MLSTQSALHNALILVAFVALAVVVAVLAVRSAERTIPLFERTIEKSSQLAVRWIVVLVFALALLASELGLDLLLGGFAAGLITRQVLRAREMPLFDSKLTAVAFGVFIPFFFVVSGMRLDVDALFASPSGVAKMAIFFVLFLVVRGTPAMLLYRRRAPAAAGPHGAGAVHLDAAAAGRRDHDRRGRRRPHAHRRRRPRWSGPARSRRSPDRCTACGCAGSRQRNARPPSPRRFSSAREPVGRHHEVRAVGRPLASAHPGQLGGVASGAGPDVASALRSVWSSG